MFYLKWEKNKGKKKKGFIDDTEDDDNIKIIQFPPRDNYWHKNGHNFSIKNVQQTILHKYWVVCCAKKIVEVSML